MSPSPTPASYTLINTRTAFHEALRSAFRDLATVPSRKVFLSDPDFADWPLNEPAVVDHLTRWAQPHRQLTLLATHFDEFPRRHPRWVTWRQNWAHVANCHAADEADVGGMGGVMPLFLVPGQWVIRLVDRVSFRGSVSREPADLVQAEEALEAILQRSQPAFPATTLGL